MVSRLNSANGSRIGLEHTHSTAAKLYEPLMLRLSQMFPDSKPTGLMYVSGVGSPSWEGLDNRHLLQARPLAVARRAGASQFCQNGCVAPVRDGRRLKGRTQSGALMAGLIGKGQIYRGKGEKCGITVCVSNQLELLVIIQCRTSQLRQDMGPRRLVSTLAFPPQSW